MKIAVFVLVIVLAGIATSLSLGSSDSPSTPAPPAPHTSELPYSFSTPGTLQESGLMHESSSPYWWLNSGGRLLIEDGVGQTMHGEAMLGDKWRKAYARTNKADTDGGARPQNIFRLISRNSFDDVRFEGRFRIDEVHLSESPSRNESNGIFLMSRYSNENNFYYAGIRVDGDAVIKKKYEGTYYTLAQTHAIRGSYDRTERPNLLPVGTWIDLATETVTENGSVTIRLYLRDESANAWREVLSATDEGSETPIFTGPAYVGVRSDFMDLSFDAFLISEL